MKILSGLPEWAWPIIVIAFFAVIVLTIIIVKKFVKPLQIKKPEIKEEPVSEEATEEVVEEVAETTEETNEDNSLESQE